MYKIYVGVINYGQKSTDNISKVLLIMNIEHDIINIECLEYPKYEYTHIILSGGPKHVYSNDSYKLPKWVINSNIPVLGICYGMQLIAYTFGGVVEHLPSKEKGNIEIIETINGQTYHYKRWMNRLDTVTYLPDIFKIFGYNINGNIAGFTDNKKWWAVQYHPESEHSLDLPTFQRFLSLSTY